MTLEECKHATTLLAFAEEMAEVHHTAEEAFFAALNRAIWQTDGVRPRTASILLHHTAPFLEAQEVTPDGYAKYDLGGLASDFMLMTQPPLQLTQKGHIFLRGGYFLENGRALYLPLEREGCYRITYRVTPPIVTAETPLDATLAMDEELCQMLPLLVAHYLLLDEEPEKAQQYLTLYREQYALVRANNVTAQGADYLTTNNW